MGRVLSCDIETDGLLDTMTTIHSLCLLDRDTGEGWSCCDHPEYVSPLGYTVLSIRDGIALMADADTTVWQNGIKFDVPAFAVAGYDVIFDRQKVIDTLLMSRLIYPDIRDRDFVLRDKLTHRIRAKRPPETKREPADWDGGEDDTPMPEGWAIDLAVWVKDQLKIRFPGHLIGSHGLEAWGYRLGEWKGDYKKEREAALKAEHEARGLPEPTKEELVTYVWGVWNPAMQSYCEQDVVVTDKLLKKLDSHGYSPQALAIERDFAWILAEMERNGFPFDREKASDLQRRLMRRHAELKGILLEAFPPKEDVTEFMPKVNNKTLGYVKGELFTKRNTVTFNPASRQHIARWLKEKYGWKPKTFTDTGLPNIDEKVLKKLQYPEAKLLAEYFLLEKRLGMLEGKGGRGLIPAGKSGRIHGNVNTNGAVTRRCTHTSPNMAQLPANNVPFGKDFRSLMCSTPGYVLLGWDASGLELRCLAHYMSYFDGGAYIKVVLDGDIHTTNAKALGLIPEDEEYDEHIPEHDFGRNKVAKRFIYAYLYGAGPEMIGDIVLPKGSTAAKIKAGKLLIAKFLARTPALKLLRERIAASVKKDKCLTAIDGGTMHVRHAHAALNTMLQSAGAIAVKVMTILFYDKLVAKGLVSGVDFLIVAHIHDEVQTLVKEGLEDVVGETAKESAREAGEILGFRCALAADYKYGSNWSETH